MAEATNILSEPSLPLAPLGVVKARLSLTGTTQHDAALSKLALGVTRAFEGACARSLVKRSGAIIVLDGCDIGIHDPLEIHHAVPMISITSLHIDRAATDPVDVVFDANTLVDPADYRLTHSGGSAQGWSPASIGVRASKHPAGFGRANVQLVASFGYTPDDGTPGWTLPNGEFAVPEDLVEAFLQQISLIWRRRDRSHLASEQFNASAGGGTISFWSQKLAKSVKEILAPYATPAAALNLGADFEASAAGQA